MRRNGKWIIPLLFTCLTVGCQRQLPVPEIAAIGSTLDAIGRRLAATYSESTLTVLVRRGPELLATLKAPERDALGRGYLRFRTCVPIVVDVAAPTTAPPFWIEDQGFKPTGRVLRNEDADWTVYRRSFEPGWVGLGICGLDRSVPAHYVVFLRVQSGGPPLDRASIELEPSAAELWSTVSVAAGVSAASDVHRPFEAIPDELHGSLMLQPRHDRRHSTLLATGRVWKTHVPSRPSPDQVAISFGNDPARMLSWNWRTAPEVESSVVRLMPAGFEALEHESQGGPDPGRIRLVHGKSSLVRSAGLLNDPVIRRHVVEIDGLQPDTTYLYSLGDGTNAGSGPWRAVKTGRDRGRIEFLYMGDVQTGLEDWGKRLVAAFRRHPGVEFILLAGDLVDRGNERTNWDHFFLRSAEIFERIPVMPCVGNHEYLDQGPRLYRSFFSLPRNGPSENLPGLVYQFECGGACFVVLDSTIAVSGPEQAKRQAKWLDDVLSQSTSRWKLVMFHHPVYPSHPWRDTPSLREHWVPIFDTHHVDLVLQGHDHAYLRTHPMRDNHAVSSNAEGTTYLVAVAGDKFCEQRSSEYKEIGFTDVSTYQTIEIDDATDRLTYRAWNDSGEIVDQLEISKPNRGRPEIARQGDSTVR